MAPIRTIMEANYVVRQDLHKIGSQLIFVAPYAM